jgi:hypothetical protein
MIWPVCASVREAQTRQSTRASKHRVNIASSTVFLMKTLQV